MTPAETLPSSCEAVRGVTSGAWTPATASEGKPAGLSGPATLMADQPTPGTGLPAWRSVLAVVAHPDDESFGLGAVLSAFADAGATVSALCFTHGEASTVHGVAGDLAAVRVGELEAAARVLGASGVKLLGYPDGAMAEVDLGELAAHVVEMASQVDADGLVAFDLDGVTGHPDHSRATAASLCAARTLGLGLLGWTLPRNTADQLSEEHGTSFTGHLPSGLDVVITVDRARQLDAIAEHRSQAVPGSVLWRRLELLGDREHLRWLR